MGVSSNRYPKSPWVSILKWLSMTWMIWGYPHDLGNPHDYTTSGIIKQERFEHGSLTQEHLIFMYAPFQRNWILTGKRVTIILLVVQRLSNVKPSIPNQYRRLVTPIRVETNQQRLYGPIGEARQQISSVQHMMPWNIYSTG